MEVSERGGNFLSSFSSTVALQCGDGGGGGAAGWSIGSDCLPCYPQVKPMRKLEDR